MHSADSLLRHRSPCRIEQRSGRAVPVLAAAVAGVLASQAPAASLWWDTSSAAGLTSGTGDWDATGGTNWATVAAPGAVAPVAWVQDSDAVIGSANLNTITIVGGTVRANSLTQVSNSAGGTTISGGKLQLGAGGYTSSLSQPMVINSDIDLAASQTWSTGTGMTVNGVIGQTSSGLSLTKSGGNGLTVTAAATYSGVTTVNMGTFTLNSGGTIVSSSGMNVFASGAAGSTATNFPQLILDNATTNNNDRVSGDLTIGRSGEFRLLGNSGANTTESIGKLTFGAGAGTVQLTQATDLRITTIAATSLDRSGAGTALIRGNFLGASNTRGGRVSLGALPSGANFVGAGGTASGDTTTKNLAIIPWVMGGNFDSSTGSGFVTYDTAAARNSIRPLLDAEYDILGAASTGYATVGNNVSIPNLSLTLNAGARSFNSLRINSTATFNGAGGAGDTLTISSGAIGHTSGTVSVGGFEKITLGNGEGVIFNNTALTINSPIDVTSSGGLTKFGGGTLVLTANNLYSGATTINQGTLQVGNGGTSGDLGTTSSIAINGGNLTFNRSDNISYGGITSLGTSANGNTGTLTHAGTGKLTLTGTNSIAGGITVNTGTLAVSGTTTAVFDAVVGATTAKGQLVIDSGASFSAPRLMVNQGAVYQKGNLVLTGGVNQTFIGNSGGQGFFQLEGGTHATAQMMLGNGSTSNGILYQTGGTLTNSFHMYLQGNGGTGRGVYYMTDGVYSGTAGTLYTAYNNSGRGELTIAGGSMSVGDAWVGNGLNTVGIVNLNGGVLQVIKVQAGGTSGDTGTRQLNFNGGTLKYAGTGAQTEFLKSSAFYNAYVLAGGAKFDVVNNIAATVDQALLAPSGDGISSTTYTITDGGAGYVGAPLVTIAGATGATAVANMVSDGAGGLKVGSITITSPGVNAVSPSFTFSGGGFTTAATPVALTTSANSKAGGLTKQGIGNLRLSRANTYEGTTTIEAGTLTLTSTGSIDNSAGVNVLAGALFDTSAKTTGYTVKGLSGSGTVKGLLNQSVTLAGAGTLSPGNSVGTLTISDGNLGLANGATYAFEVGGTTAAPTSDRVNLTGASSTITGLVGNSYTLSLANLGSVDPTGLTFVLFDYVGANPSNIGTWTLNYGTTGWSGGEVTLDSTNTRIILSGLTAVPEPSSIALLGLGVLGHRRRRLSAQH